METTPLQNSPDVKNSVLARIEREGVCPRGRWQFVGKECAVWTAWILTVALAAVAAAITFLVVMHRQYTFYEATHASFWGFMFAVLPYLWIVVFVISATLALYHLKSTKRGYRYPLWGVLVTSVFASMAGGTLLHYYGMSYMLDHELGEYMPGYQSQAALEKQFWQMPSEGRLLATYLREADSVRGLIVVDTTGVEWFTNIDELYERDLELLRSGKSVRLLGTIPGDATPQRFHACGAFPWMYDHVTSMSDMYQDRKEAIARLRQHMERRLGSLPEGLPGDGQVGSEGRVPTSKVLAGEGNGVGESVASIEKAIKDPQCPYINAMSRLAPQ